MEFLYNIKQQVKLKRQKKEEKKKRKKVMASRKKSNDQSATYKAWGVV